MSTRFAKFAPQNTTAANAAADYLDSVLPAGIVPFARYLTEGADPDLPGSWYLPVDTNGNWVLGYPFDGPFVYAGSTIPAPPGAAAAFTLAVIVDTPDWPPEA